MEVERIAALRNSDVFEVAKQVQSCLRQRDDFVDFKSGRTLLTFEQAYQINSNLMDWGDRDYVDCLKIIHADNARFNRMFGRLKMFMDSGTCLFLTLTFTDDALKIQEDTRRTYVRRFLKSHSDLFIANIDFGSKTGREHYHAVIRCDDVKIVEDWKYGWSNAQVIVDDPASIQRVARYIVKIAAHFVKDTTKKCRLIYSVYRSKWDYVPSDHSIPKKPVEKQLCFWDHLPSSCDSNFDREDYLE